MIDSLPKPFPALDVSEDRNPAMRLFGLRFFQDQTVLEYLTEFLSVVSYPKWLADGEPIRDPLPPLSVLRSWSDQKLRYKPPVRLNLKLFALLGASRADSRHETHLEHYRVIFDALRRSISSDQSAERIVRVLEELLRGYQGAGLNRTWCAQTFYPVTASLITQETLWNDTVAKKRDVRDWNEAVSHFHTFFSVSKHRFMARGGELLYLQICNALTRDSESTADLAWRVGITENEGSLETLHASLQDGLAAVYGVQVRSLDRLVEYIEGLHPETHGLTNEDSGDGSNAQVCGWCPRDSWQEGYLFAVELSRVLSAALDPIERLELLMTGCTLQVLRSLCAQSARYAEPPAPNGRGGVLGYAWIFTHPYSASRPSRLASQRNLQAVQALIYRALRHPALQDNAGRAGARTDLKTLNKEADTKYGHKLFLSLGKKLGIIAPLKGSGARFVMTDGLLRYLVMALLRPEERCTDRVFIERLYRHYGIAVEGENLTDAVLWSGLPANSSVQPERGSWLAEMLRAGGFLTELSDACAVVRHPFGKLRDDRRNA
mgnify:CR=1 FL=1